VDTKISQAYLPNGLAEMVQGSYGATGEATAMAILAIASQHTEKSC
jgi:hypothetical protein